ncbi:hypothetical protein ACLB2K_024118 [Fragaria x ananassa]
MALAESRQPKAGQGRPIASEGDPLAALELTFYSLGFSRNFLHESCRARRYKITFLPLSFSLPDPERIQILQLTRPGPGFFGQLRLTAPVGDASSRWRILTCGGGLLRFMMVRANRSLEVSGGGPVGIPTSGGGNEA